MTFGAGDAGPARQRRRPQRRSKAVDDDSPTDYLTTLTRFYTFTLLHIHAWHIRVWQINAK